uniref:Uncharacterized protein n=1 Tax=Ascaris lumbricoides TaxID=6252 RepID=A0A9J2PY17_ASCLU
MAAQSLKQEMANVLAKLQQDQNTKAQNWGGTIHGLGGECESHDTCYGICISSEAATLEKEEAATKFRIDVLHEHLFKVQKKLLEEQARIRELDMHRDAFRYLQESQNELLESMEKMRNGVKLDCENKLKTLEEVRAQMRDVKEPSFAPQIYAELIESLRICRPENDGEEGTTLDDEAKNVREKLELCLNEINELKTETDVLDGELKKIHLAGISVDDMRAVLRSIQSETLKLNAKMIEYRLKRHRLEANGLVGNLD